MVLEKSLTLKGRLNSSQRAKGERLIFLSLPKPNYFEIEARKSKNETEIIEWKAHWEGTEICNNVLKSSEGKSEYWKPIIIRCLLKILQENRRYPMLWNANPKVLPHPRSM